MESGFEGHSSWDGHPISMVISTSEPSSNEIIDVVRRDEDPQLPSYEFIIEQTTPNPPSGITNLTHVGPRPSFRPAPLNQLTSDDAIRLLDSADAFWDQERWCSARTSYTTAASAFHIIEDKRNEAFCLQRLGEVCRIRRDFKAARAHIWQAHVLFGRCGEVSRQLMCERWLSRVASDEGSEDEARMLLHGALDHSRAAGLRESEGWCLLRLGELEEMNETLIQQALVIAQEDKIGLLERSCTSSLLRRHGIGTSTAASIAESLQSKIKTNVPKVPFQVDKTGKEEKGKEKQSLDTKIDPDALGTDKDTQTQASSSSTLPTGSPRLDVLSSVVKRLKRWFEKT